MKRQVEQELQSHGSQQQVEEQYLEPSWLDGSLPQSAEQKQLYVQEQKDRLYGPFDMPVKSPSGVAEFAGHQQANSY